LIKRYDSAFRVTLEFNVCKKSKNFIAVFGFADSSAFKSLDFLSGRFVKSLRAQPDTTSFFLILVTARPRCVTDEALSLPIRRKNNRRAGCICAVAIGANFVGVHLANQAPPIAILIWLNPFLQTP
jgi:hypothetical protein